MNETPAVTIELRPMGIGDILDTTLRLYRRNFASFLSIALITYVPYALVIFLLRLFLAGEPVMVQTPFGPQPQPDSASMAIGWLSYALLMFVVYPLTSGALTYAIAGQFLGQRLGPREAYGRAVGRVGALIGTQIMVGLVVGIGIALLVVPGVIFALWFMIVPAIVLLERTSGSTAMGRGRELMKGNLGKGFVLNLVLALLIYAVMFGVGMVVHMLGLPLAVVELVTDLLTAVLLPVQLAAIVLLYYDLRIRKEAFDLEVLAGSLPGKLSTE